MHSVQLITDTGEFAALESDWNDAVERSGLAHPFLRHEWMRAWWECFGGSHQLHVLVVRFDGRIGAVAPLMSERSQMYGVPIRRLRLMHNDHTPRADFIVAERAAESYQAIWEALKRDDEQWDVLQLGQLPDESPTREWFRRTAAVAGRATGVWQSSASPYLRLRADWEAYAATLTPKFRQNLRNRLSRLANLGDPALEVLADAAEIRAALPDALRLERSGWKDTEGTAIESDAAVHRFYTTLAGERRQCQWLRLLFLTLSGKRIATSLAAIYANRLFLLKTGYDPEYAKCSPFKLLTYFALRHAIDAGLEEVDFLGDTEGWKLEWTPTIRPHEWLFVFSGTPRARLLHPIKFQFVPALKRLHGSVTCTFQPSRV